jgi:hypothetical protein
VTAPFAQHDSPDQQGIIPNAFRHIFEAIEGNGIAQKQFLVRSPAAHASLAWPCWQQAQLCVMCLGTPPAGALCVR